MSREYRSEDQTASEGETPNVSLRLESRPENVALVREAITGLGEAFDIEPTSLDDMRTAVTEACNNVVQHAYGTKPGPIDIEVCLESNTIVVAVRDEGSGIQPRIRRPTSETLGIGVLVIKALSESVEFRDRAERGLEVRMSFAAPGTKQVESLDGVAAAHLARSYANASHTLSVCIGPPPLVHTILPRLLTTIASRAHFSTDRLSDVQLIGDSIALHAGDAIEGTHVSAAIEVSPRSLQVAIGPFRPGGAAKLIAASAVPGVGPVIERLADAHESQLLDTIELLQLRIDDGRQARGDRTREDGPRAARH